MNKTDKVLIIFGCLVAIVVGIVFVQAYQIANNWEEYKINNRTFIIKEKVIEKWLYGPAYYFFNNDGIPYQVTEEDFLNYEIGDTYNWNPIK